MSESRVTCATCVLILVIGLSVLDLGLRYATDVRRRQTDVRRASSLNAPVPRVRIEPRLHRNRLWKGLELHGRATSPLRLPSGPCILLFYETIGPQGKLRGRTMKFAVGKYRHVMWGADRRPNRPPALAIMKHYRLGRQAAICRPEIAHHFQSSSASVMRFFLSHFSRSSIFPFYFFLISYLRDGMTFCFNFQFLSLLIFSLAWLRAMYFKW